MNTKDLLPLLPERLIELRRFGHDRHGMQAAIKYAAMLNNAGINYDTDVIEYHQHSDFVFETDTSNYKKAKQKGLD